MCRVQSRHLPTALTGLTEKRHGSAANIFKPRVQSHRAASTSGSVVGEKRPATDAGYTNFEDTKEPATPCQHVFNLKPRPFGLGSLTSEYDPDDLLALRHAKSFDDGDNDEATLSLKEEDSFFWSVPAGGIVEVPRQAATAPASPSAFSFATASTDKTVPASNLRMQRLDELSELMIDGASDLPAHDTNEHGTVTNDAFYTTAAAATASNSNSERYDTPVITFSFGGSHYDDLPTPPATPRHSRPKKCKHVHKKLPAVLPSHLFLPIALH